jgi:hypothetical protein
MIGSKHNFLSYLHHGLQDMRQWINIRRLACVGASRGVYFSHYSKGSTDPLPAEAMI